jgi:hypothetical protein
VSFISTYEKLEGINHTRIKEILRQLCRDTYESPFDGIDWEEAINKAIERLRLFLKNE